MSKQPELWVVVCRMQDGTKVLYGPARRSELTSLYRHLDRHGDAIGVVGLSFKTKELYDADEELNSLTETKADLAKYDRLKILADKVESVDGRAVKIDGFRPDYMSSHLLLDMIPQYANALEDMRRIYGLPGADGNAIIRIVKDLAGQFKANFPGGR